MSLRELRDARALMLRLVLAELVAKRGEGPLARRGWPPSKPKANANALRAALVAARGKDE